MARVTVEDCILKVPNRFDLVMRAAQRARSIYAGAPLTIDRDDDKDAVVALREIAEETIDLDELRSSLIRSLQKFVEMDEPEGDEMDLAAIQRESDGEAEPAPVVETTVLTIDGETGKAETEVPASETAVQVLYTDVEPEKAAPGET